MKAPSFQTRPFKDAVRRLGCILFDCTVRRSIGRFACLLCGFAAFTTSFANAEEASAWTEMISGTTEVRGAGPVQYSIGYSSVSYDHFLSEIVVEWRDGGDRTQTIYDGIYDNPPAKVWGVDGHLCVSMETCARYEDVCTTHVIAYLYDVVAKSFTELEDGQGQCHR